MLLFVYGTLLRGEENHHVLGGAQFVREARSAPRYTLVDLGPYPALLLTGDTAVCGEAYEIDSSMLAFLDEFEGCPDLYERSQVELEDGCIAIAYTLSPKRAHGVSPIASGDYRSFRRRGGR